MANQYDFTLVDRCKVIYQGPTFPNCHGRRCDRPIGHETLPTTHPLHARRHAGGEGNERISWFDKTQKERGEVGY